jgi:molybdopterin synthase sulfur carrier subunit
VTGEREYGGETMLVDIWYFARIKEAVDCEQEKLELPDRSMTVRDLVDRLSQRGENWRKALNDDNVLVAVNQTVASMQTTIAEGDEIAFFPPVTGG